MRVEPKLIPIKGELNKFDRDYWTPSVGIQVLGDKNAMQKLGAIDPTSLDKKVMLELEALMASP